MTTIHYSRIKYVRWAEVNRLSLGDNDPNAAYEYFLSAYKDIFDHCFPEKLLNLRIG